MIRVTCLALMLAGLVGCTLAPQYKRPAASVAPAWPTGPAYQAPRAMKGGPTNGVAGRAAADIAWQEFFRDPRLRKVVELALRNNRDLRAAILRVEQSQAQYRITRSALFPKVNATGNGLVQHLPSGIYGGRTFSTSEYSVELGVTAYELDLFGRVRSLRRQALEQYFATIEARRSAQITLVAAVAVQYLAKLEMDEQLSVARQTLHSVRAFSRLIEQSYKAGNASELDVRSAQAQVAAARASVASYLRQQAQAENALVLLVGEPLPVNLPPSRTLESQELLADLPAGLPSDLLERRPDILEAEHQLQAANANIGAARAAFFPRIALTAAGGTASLKLSDLFAPGTEIWSFTPQITLPIFAGGENVANLKSAEVSRQIDVALYQKAIQTAFREVADALAARGTLNDQLDAQAALVQAEQQRYHLAQVRYQNGIDSYLNVLTAQQDLYAARQGLIQLRYIRLANRVNLYEALGGGWRPSASQDRKHPTSSIEQPMPKG